MNLLIKKRLLSAGLVLTCSMFALNVYAAKTHVINMTDAPPYFDNTSLDIKIGDTVTWRNAGPDMYHIVMDREITLFSEDVNVGNEWSYEFNKAGVYDYICHRHFFMRGKITVRNEDGSMASEPDHAYQPAFTEYVVPTMNSVPRMIIASKVDDNIWFTEGGGDFYGFEDIPSQNKLGRLSPDGQFVEYATPTSKDGDEKIGVDSLVMDDDGNIYFTERFTNRIGVLDPQGNMVEHQIPTKGGYALGVDIDKKGNIWFAERYGNRIGYIDKEGKIKEIELPDEDSEPRTIFVDSQQRIWYTARVANEIGYYDTKTEEFVRLHIPTKLARPAGIAETSDGTVYFVEMVGNKVAKVVGDKIVEYSIPTPFTAPFKVYPDADDNLWFTQVYGNSIGKMDTKTGKITEYKIPTVDSRPGGITVDKNGIVWFTEQMGNKIGRFDPKLADELIAKDALSKLSKSDSSTLLTQHSSGSVKKK
ncbi:hypothetical protein HWQ46_07230 [Shewanella sp. D64]|uniref:virginiamycin B lyase family protein n=1 Tax=unclassified Shewanella TaxID=196818 RepID=UPI0022BA225C|nr:MULTISPECIES: plastocyanin/azurin family copper-binding protein [unclassified Shewanella]MEC4725336.1 hypothetical protein [Shewanella sp. D64]MEC4735818.1 hypothetical protein [Shewanella sp. E94]WBJ93211.1 hypothetical protein HWQ47_14730 [Shewanella sp. MTB7]